MGGFKSADLVVYALQVLELNMGYWSDWVVSKLGYVR